jgi:polyisoprenoid-binding protein YceI
MKFSRKLSWLFLFYVNVHFVTAQENAWTVTNKTITFTIKNAKLPVQGSFTGIMAKIVFNPESIKTSTFSATITASTIKTGIEMRDRHLKRSEYFDVLKYPEIKLKSNAIVLVNDNNYMAKCTLTIKGIAKEVNLPFSFINNGKTAIFKGILNINRLDFHVGSSSIIMANQLQVQIEVNAIAN